jgi:hypothetical protein
VERRRKTRMVTPVKRVGTTVKMEQGFRQLMELMAAGRDKDGR